MARSHTSSRTAHPFPTLQKLVMRFAFATLALGILPGIPHLESLSGGLSFASEAQPSFPDHCLRLKPSKTPGARVTSLPDPAVAPFSWDQTLVTREGNAPSYVIQAFDPDFNPVEIVRKTDPILELFTVIPSSNFLDFGTVDVIGWDDKLGRITLRVPAVATPITDTQFFRVYASGISDGIAYPFTVDIRKQGDNRIIRSRPLVLRSVGLTTPPGHIIRFRWNKSNRLGAGKLQEFLFETSGRTGKAVDVGSLVQTTTFLRAVKVRPLVLGHYVTLVSPWNSTESILRQREGSTSNGSIIHCRFGSQNLAPVSDGLIASTFFPAVGETVTDIQPIATDPETAQDENTGFSGNVIDYFDGSAGETFNTATSHTFNTPGIYKAVCLIKDLPVPNAPNPDIAPGPDGIAEDLFIVGSTAVPASGKGAGAQRVAVTLKKQIPIQEGGEGEANKDRLSITWNGISANVGDQLVFCFNRNRFGRMHTDPVPGVDEIDDRIVLGARRRWVGSTPQATNVRVTASNNSVRIIINKATLDRTGDPRFGGAERTGEQSGNTVALCIIPATFPSTPIQVFHMKTSDLLRFRLKGGSTKGTNFDPEISISARSTPGP